MSSLAEDVAALLARLRGEPEANIQLNTRLVEDLRIVGDDWDEVVGALSSLRQIDWTGFEFHRYFYDEPTLLTPLQLVWRRMRYGSRHQLTVGHLVKVLECGKWFNPPVQVEDRESPAELR